MNALLLQFKALADATRLRIMAILLHHELNVNELVAVLDMGQSRVSRHLRILAESGLVQWRRDGLWVFYRATAEPTHTLVALLKDILAPDEADTARLDGIRRASEQERTRLFDNLAPQWDEARREIIEKFPLEEEITARVPEGVIADLGCGNGVLLSHLVSAERQLIGVDQSAQMLEEARHRFGTAKADLRLGALPHLPMKENEADAVVLSLVLHHLADPEQVFPEVQRVLKRHGQLIITDLLRHDREDFRSRFGHRWLGFDPEEIRQSLEAMDFADIQTDTHSLPSGLELFILQARVKE